MLTLTGSEISSAVLDQKKTIVKLLLTSKSCYRFKAKTKTFIAGLC